MEYKYLYVCRINWIDEKALISKIAIKRKKGFQAVAEIICLIKMAVPQKERWQKDYFRENGRINNVR